MDQNQMQRMLLRVNDGFTDATSTLNAIFDLGGEIYIPQGRYRVTSTLKLPSHTHLTAHSQAWFFLCGDTPKKAHEYLLTNSDPIGGNEDIEIVGGVWDGNNQGKENRKGDLFDLNAYSGTTLNFFHVKRLSLRSLTVANSVAYNIRMARIDGFTVEDIAFVSDAPSSNQDGLHLNGECRNGTVKRLTALSKGQTGDDLIAFNADDCMERVENVGMVRGDIENVVVEDLFAEECHTIIRLLSTTHAIRNVTIRNVLAGYKEYAVNMDCARYCRTPLFREEDCPTGMGRIEHVLIENMTCYTEKGGPAVALESNAAELTFRNFRFIRVRENDSPALNARNLYAARIYADGREYTLNTKADTLRLNDFTDLTF